MLQQLSLAYAYIHRLDYSFCTLLAAGYFGFGTVSNFLVANFTVQITWYSGGWSFWLTKKHHHAAWQIATTVVSFALAEASV